MHLFGDVSSLEYSSHACILTGRPLMASWRVGYDYTSLPPSAFAPDNYAVFMCPVGAFVTSLGLYASSNYYTRQPPNPINYIGVYRFHGPVSCIAYWFPIFVIIVHGGT